MQPVTVFFPIDDTDSTMPTLSDADMTSLNIDRVLNAAESLRARFEQISSETDYEAKGIFFSEALFVGACCHDFPPKRFIESGRARGQSTVVLAKSFPECPLISVEFDSRSPDCQVAAKRLAPYPNVELRFGDSMKLLPELAQAGDSVIIDGPKHFHALRLGLRLLRLKRAERIFIHDLHRGTPERRFVDRELPGVLYSDHPEFVRRYSYLDDVCWRTGYPGVEASGRATLFGGSGEYSYGPTFAGLFSSALKLRPGAELRLRWAALRNKWRKSRTT